jgi:hypothetical protein
MLKHIAPLALLLAVSLGVTAAPADDKPYRDGPVTDVSFIRVKDGKLLDYMKHLGGTYRQLMDAYKKAGLINEYHIYQATPRTPQDANIILTITYPNYAAFDRTGDFDTISAKIEGSLKSADKNYADRGAIRDVIGSELVRELILK